MDYFLFGFVFLAGLFPNAICLQTDYCEDALGMQDEKIKDHHITASSYYDNAVNAIYGRAHAERGGGAWCPRGMIHNKGTEFIEINLNSLYVLTKVEVQGRFGNGQGREYAEKYKLQYWREGLGHWMTYKDGRSNELLEGNSNTYLAKATRLQPPVIVSRVRFVPFSDHPRTICMRVEVYGCPYTDGLVSYSMIDGDMKNGDHGLKDITYDGVRDNGWLSGGLGQLTDGETGHSNFRVDAIGKGRGYEWVGWKNDTRGQNPVDIIFKFDAPRNFTAMHLYTNNLFTRDARTFCSARISFSAEGKKFTASRPVHFSYSIDRIFEKARNISIKLHGSVGQYVKVQLFFSLRWLMISEITFDSVLCNCNITDNDEPLVANVESETEKDKIVPVPDNSTSIHVIGILSTLGIIFGILGVVMGIYFYRNRFVKNKSKPPIITPIGVSDNGKISMKMKDFQINMNLSPTNNGYSRAKNNLYGDTHMEEEVAAMYQEPYKGPIHNQGYYTLNRDSSETLIKCVPGSNDYIDYAVPHVNMTPPPPFSEVYTPPPPVPSSRPPTLKHETKGPLIPCIPPPPEQQYYAAPKLCQPSNIQSVTGTVVYSALDTTSFNDELIAKDIPRQNICVLDKIGEGNFGMVQLCEVIEVTQHTNGKTLKKTENKMLAAMKSLKPNVNSIIKDEFKREAQMLAQLQDPNIISLLGVVNQKEPIAMILEYMDFGDLNQFLRRHICEGVTARLPALPNGGSPPPVLSYGALVYIGTQISSGMKYLENLNFVHRDLATRNCLVGSGLTIKISDFGMSQSLYSNDYYRLEGRAVLPVRWMAWESILQGRFTNKSDVWAFGVTLWEILTMARRQPFDELSNEGVIENVSHCFHDDGTGMIVLPHPPLCPREMYDMLTACWRANERQRPPFWEIHMFLKRMNLSFSIDYAEDV